MVALFYTVLHFYERQLRRHRLRSFAVRARVAAKLCGSRLDLDLAPDVRLGRRCRVEIASRTVNRLVVGARTRLADGVVIRLRGGDVELGADADIRAAAILNVSGRLHVGDAVFLGPWVFLHCDDDVAIGDLTMVAERVTIADSNHIRTPAGTMMHHSVQTAPVHVGSNVWIGAGAVVTAGANVGDEAFVGANAVVTGDVPTATLAAGNPARVVRTLSSQVEPTAPD